MSLKLKLLDPFTLDIDIVQAIRIIQKNDRGRQGR
jgi:phage anti-repressor protein